VSADAESIALPAHRYLPGRSERHPDDAFDHVKALAPKETRETTAHGNVAWQYGLRLFNHGFYWEAHEVLEEVWMRAPPNSRERWLVQCVIHLANGALKKELGQQRAVLRLAGLARECGHRAFAGGEGLVMGLADDEVEVVCVALEGAGNELSLGNSC